MTKAELRSKYLAERQALSDDKVAAGSRQIADRWFSIVDLASLRNLHIFVPIRKFNEVDTSLIYQRIWADFPWIRTFLPRLDFSTQNLECIEFREDTVFAENKWGISEVTIGDKIDAAEIDLVVVPLLCFDKRGYRIGYGRGLYDRFLATARKDCMTTGLSLFPPVDRISNVDRYDIGLNICITPDETFTFAKHGNAE